MKMNRTISAAVILAASSISMNAQNAPVEQRPADVFPAASEYRPYAPATKAPRRTKAAGLYYTNPAGTYYSAARDVDPSTGDAMEYPYSYTAYSETRLVVPALAQFTFANRSQDAASTVWQWNVFSYDALKEYGYVTDGNNLSLMLANRRSTEEMYDVPILSSASGDNTFLFGEKNYISYMVVSPETHYLGLNDYQVTHMYATMSDGAYVFGTGQVRVSASECYPSEGVLQYFDRPASPLYIDRFNIACLSKTDFLDSSHKLTLTVYNVVTGADGTKRPGNEVLYTATAGAENVNYETEQGGVKYGSIDFSRWTASLKLIPVVIDQPFCVVITGFSQPGVDVGIRGCDMSQDEASENVEQTCVLASDGENLQTLVNRNFKLGMALTFRAMFDNIMVLNEENSGAAYNVARVSADGKTHLTDGKTEADGLATVPVYTACPWKDSKGNMNYYWDVDAANSWVKGVSADGSQYESKGMYGLQFTCDPLPAGVAGRSATIWLKGKGAAASTPIVLLQGEAQLSGAGSVSYRQTASDDKTYNMSGQQVGEGYKGLVIRDGKKFLAR